MKPIRLAALAGAMLLAPMLTFAQTDFVWWEGEDVKETNFPNRTAFAPANDLAACERAD